VKINTEFNAPRIEHLAVWAEDIDETVAFLEDALGWRRHPLEFGVDENDEVFGGMELAFVDANGLWLELVQPTTEGPGMEFLKEKGNGSLVELDFLIDDFDRNIETMKARGIDLIGMDGNPIQGDGLLREWVRIDGKMERGDERLSYLPFDLACGTSIELLWEDPETGVVVRRNENSSESHKTPSTAPRLDSVVVLGEDLEKSANVFTDILRLERNSSQSGVNRPWMNLGEMQHTWINGNSDSIWIELIAPASTQSNTGILEKHGEGAIMELCAEVDDIEAFYDRMQDKGITMTAGDCRPLVEGEKAVADTNTGDRFSYFPLDKSKGMRIMVFQRGTEEKSVFSARDKAA
jgi:catechol 2,3-dioxygenase-like lactoylglutathione lyase family enzyme